MRPEKSYLIKEASDYLTRSDYFFLTDYKGINAEETSELRKKLSERGAEFHVVKIVHLRSQQRKKNYLTYQNIYQVIPQSWLGVMIHRV